MQIRNAQTLKRREWGLINPKWVANNLMMMRSPRLRNPFIPTRNFSNRCGRPTRIDEALPSSPPWKSSPSPRKGRRIFSFCRPRLMRGEFCLYLLQKFFSHSPFTWTSNCLPLIKPLSFPGALSFLTQKYFFRRKKALVLWLSPPFLVLFRGNPQSDSYRKDTVETSR